MNIVGLDSYYLCWLGGCCFGVDMCGFVKGILMARYQSDFTMYSYVQ